MVTEFLKACQICVWNRCHCEFLGNFDKKWVGSKIVGYYKLLEVKSFSGLMCPKVFSTGTPGSSVESSARKRQETSSGLGWNR